MYLCSNDGSFSSCERNDSELLFDTDQVAKDEDFVESYTFLEPNPRLGLESEQRIRNKISFELNETALAAASVMNILLCY